MPLKQKEVMLGFKSESLSGKGSGPDIQAHKSQTSFTLIGGGKDVQEACFFTNSHEFSVNQHRCCFCRRNASDAAAYHRAFGASNVTLGPQAFVCPAGWHRKPGPAVGNATYACVPNKPAPIKCPEVAGKTYKYYEALTCTGTEGGTGGDFKLPATCGGCELGCRDVTPPR